MSEFSQPKLLRNRNDHLLAALFLLLLLSFSLTYRYQHYLELKRFTWQEVQTTLLAQKKSSKNGKTRVILELQSKNLHFFTFSKHPLKKLLGQTVTLAIYTNDLRFKPYLTSFFAYSKIIGIEDSNALRWHLTKLIHRQHEDPLIANLYGALFLVEPIAPGLRQKLTALGINHLAAISGFHLGFLAMILLFVLNLLIKPLQQSYFPYFHRHRLVMLLTLALLLCYSLFLDFTPSLIRAYVMMAVGFIFFDRGIKLLSFELLLFSVLMILSLLPQLLFSLGFWLSTLGVTMIFLLLKSYAKVSKVKLALLINFGVFVLMTPLVLALFKTVGPGQLLSPFLTLGFTLFYPAALLMHLLGHGDLMDPLLAALFDLDFDLHPIAFDPLLLTLYLLLLLLSSRYKAALWGSIGYSSILLTYFLS